MIESQTNESDTPQNVGWIIRRGFTAIAECLVHRENSLELTETVYVSIDPFAKPAHNSSESFPQRFRNMSDSSHYPRKHEVNMLNETDGKQKTDVPST